MTDQPTSPLPSPDPAPEAEGGRTWISDDIVAKVAAAAAREVDGVEALRGGGIRRGWVRASERLQGGARVKVDDGRATIGLRLVVRYGVAIPAVVEEVRARVVERVEFATGLTVARVDIGVVDVVGPQEEDLPDAPGAEASIGPI
jgi:uncharacterized alkaline shock family protein YloU